METIGLKDTPRHCSTVGCGARLKDTVLDWEVLIIVLIDCSFSVLFVLEIKWSNSTPWNPRKVAFLKIFMARKAFSVTFSSFQHSSIFVKATFFLSRLDGNSSQMLQ